MQLIPIALAARHGGPEPVRQPVPELLEIAEGPSLHSPLSRGGGVVAPLNPTGLAAALATLLRSDRLVVSVLLDRPARTFPLAAQIALDRAQRSPLRIAVDAPPHDPRTVPLTAALRMFAAIARDRTAATWRAVEMLDAHAGNAERAAAALGCSGQAVRRHRQRSHYSATVEFGALLEVLFAAPRPTRASRIDAPADETITRRPFWST